MNVAQILTLVAIYVATCFGSELGEGETKTHPNNQLHYNASQGSNYFRFVSTGEHKLAERYPELFGKEAEATIVILKAPWCRACRIHATTVWALQDRRYRVRTYNIDDHSELHEFFGKPRIPYTALLKSDKKQNEWSGIVNWRYIARSADSSYRLQ